MFLKMKSMLVYSLLALILSVPEIVGAEGIAAKKRRTSQERIIECDSVSPA